MKYLFFAICCLLSFSAKALDASISYATFYSPSGNYVEVYMHFAGKSISFRQLPDSSLQANVDIVILFKQEDEILKFDKYRLNSPSASVPIDFVDSRRYALENGTYELEVTVTDANDPENISTYSAAFELAYEAEKMGQSDIQLLASIQKAEGSVVSTMVKNGYLFEPLATQFYDRSAQTLLFYNEIYNTDKTFEGDFLVSYAIEELLDESKTKRIQVGYRRCSPEAICPVVQQVDIANLPSGNYLLVVEVANRYKEVFSRKSVQFQRSNPFVKSSREEIAAKVETLADEFVSKLSDEELRYSLKAIAMLVDDHDGEVLNLILKESKRKAMELYLFSFWARENPANPEIAYDDYMHVARAVDLRFNNGFGYGFETDRGYIFMKYGAPNDVVTIEDEPSAPPYEIWTYNQFPATGQNNVKFLFYNPSLAMNGFILLHSTARGEVNNPRWEVELYKNAPNEVDGSDFVSGSRMQDNIGRKARQLMSDY
ncbi:MAG: hypothetical protein CMN32_05820 [Saprospirales bacterium]|nr:hypothetical protein [Saprospirales bacterium]